MIDQLFGSWSDFAAIVLIAFGLAYVVGMSKISLPFRILLAGNEAETPLTVNGITIKKGEPAVPSLIPYVGPFLVLLVECPACFGFWEGAAFAMLRGGGPLYTPLFTGLVICATNLLLTGFTVKMEGKP